MMDEDFLVIYNEQMHLNLRGHFSISETNALPCDDFMLLSDMYYNYLKTLEQNRQ